MKQVISTGSAPKAIGPYNQAIETNTMIFLSGQIPINPATGKIIAKSIEEQTEQVMKNIGNILKAAGCNYSNVVKTTCFLTDLIYFKSMNEIYAKYFTFDFPARSTVQVVALPMGALIEIECIALK